MDAKGKHNKMTMEVIAKQLIQEKFILTALEFHTELIESGNELLYLRDYFSNPSNFEQICSKSLSGEVSHISALNRSSSQTTLDSLDWARFSEDGERLLDDKIAVLEFELRKAKETIQVLRDNLTQATAQNEGSQNQAIELEDSENTSIGVKGNSDLKPHEICTLNFLVNEYLVMRNYKMTANTFADENANQDFENWDDVGLNIPRPPTLVHWLHRKIPQLAPTSCISIQTEELPQDPEIDKLHEIIASLRDVCKTQEEELLELHTKLSAQKIPTAEENNDDIECEISPCQSEATNTDFFTNNVDSIEEMLENVVVTSEDYSPNSQVGSNHYSPEAEATPAVEDPPVEDERPPSEPSEVLDPRKCDRLPPLGASSEFPQGILAGEFLPAQRDEAVNLLRRSSSRNLSPHLESLILNRCFESTSGVHSRLQNQVVALSLGKCDLLNLVCASLHNIAPNVILTKREELLPLLIYCIIEQTDSKERERLLHLLFNLTKRPDKEQRSTILLGVVSLARILGAERLEAELLPQCWEQLSHKHSERRLLVAQSVAVLAPYTPTSLRNSLLLSMLEQLIGSETDDAVFEAIIDSLAMLTLYLDDVHKIPSLVAALVSCMERTPSSSILLHSALASWSLDVGKLRAFMEPQFLRIQQVAKDLNTELLNSGKRSHIELLEQSLAFLLQSISATCPFLLLELHDLLEEDCSGGPITLVLDSGSIAEEIENLLGSKEEASKILQRVHSLQDVFSRVTDSYVSSGFMETLASSVALIGLKSKRVLREVSNLVTRIASCFGAQATKEKLLSLFAPMLVCDLRQKEAVRSGATAHTKAPLVASLKAASLIPSGDAALNHLASHVTFLALCDAPMDALRSAFELLLEGSGTHQETVLGALWSCLVHEKSCVRAATAPLWNILIGCVRETELASRVVPALVTLATDSDVVVRASAIAPLTAVVASAPKIEVVDKVTLQLDSVCEESQVVEFFPLQLAIAQCCTALGHNAPVNLLHNLFLPRLSRCILEGAGSPEEKVRLGCSVLQTFAALDSSSMPNHVVAHFVLPPLNQLQKTLGAMSYEHMEAITVLTKEYTLRAQVAHQSMSYNLGSASAALSEDVKNKVSKMFASKANVLPAKASINFFKKK